MIIFLYGADAYRRHQNLKEITEEYKTRHPNFVLENFDLEEKDEFSKLQEFSLNRSFFEEIKLAVLENTFEASAKEIKNFLKDSIEKEDLILVLSENKSAPKAFSFLLNKPVQSQEFKELKYKQLEFFIGKEAKNRGLVLTERAAQFLSEVFSGDSWSLVKELDKLALANKDKLDIADLKQYSDYSLSYNIFSFINNLNGFDTARNLHSLETLFSYREEPAKIFNFLAFSRTKSRELTQKLANYDVLVKLGKLDYEEALLDLALS
ncbi:MAG: hypothetical protein WC297_02950 [Candidatus Paceibacterota bacterium]|jgi:DNA polymerase III delta subunit